MNELIFVSLICYAFNWKLTTLSLNCKEAGGPTCSHIITGETEQELFYNAKKHAMEEHGMTAEEFDEDAKK